MANYTTMSLDATKLLCGLIRDLASVSEGIDNLHLADNLTFSNIYIKNLVDKCLEDANAEAQKLVGALTHLTCEETTVQPTLDNSEINVIYLYSADGNAPYQQYLKISDTKLVDLGSTSISLTDYIKAADVAKDYATKTELKAVTDKIGTTALTTTAQTLTGSIEEVKTSVPTDDDIKLLADGQIDSKKQILGFNDLKGITADSTLDDVVKAVPNGKIAILQSANFTNYLGLPHQMYTITINSLGYNRNQIIATAKYSDSPSISFIGGCDNSSGTDIYDQWIKMPTTNDITTTISSASTETEIPSAKAVFQFVGDGKNKLETAIIDKGGIVSKVGDVITFDELASSIKALHVKSGFGQVTNYVKNSSLTTLDDITVWASDTTVGLTEQYYLNGRVCQVNSSLSTSVNSKNASYLVALTDELNVSDIGTDTELIGSCWVNPSTFKCDNSNAEFKVFLRCQREGSTSWFYSSAPTAAFTTIDMEKNQWQRSYAKFNIKDIDSSNISKLRLMFGFKNSGSTANEYTFSGEFKIALPSLIQVSSLQSLPNEKTEIELLQELIK